MDQQFATFEEFYPFYLSEHTNQTCRRLHFVGICLVLLVGMNALWTGHWIRFLWMPVVGYTCSWIGHFVFEKNRPATFKYPFFSLRGDFVMFKDILTGKIKF